MGRPQAPQRRRGNQRGKGGPVSRRGNVRGKVQNSVPLTRKPIIRDPINYDHVVHLLTQHCDPRVVEQRIKKVLGFHETDKPFTLEDFGVKNFIDKTNGKINGELTNKRPDTRLVETSLDGSEAQPVSYEAPLHPLQETPVEELEIVTEGLITAEKINEILEAKKTGKKVEIDLKEDITEEQSKKLRDVIQVLVGHFVYATVSNKKLIVRKYIPIKDKRTDSWLWEKSHVKFVLARNLRFPNILERVAKILGLKSHKNFNRTHLSFDVGYVHQFIQVKQIDPVSIKEAFEKENANVSNFELVDTMLEKNVYRGHKLKFSIRKVTSSEEEIENAMENFAKFGFINYFFATPSVLARASITEVGRNLIKNDFMGAAKVLIRPRPLDRSGYEELKALSFISQDAGVIAPIIREQIHPNNTNLAARVLNVMVNDQQGRLSPRNAHLAFEKNNTEQIIKYTDLYLQYIFNETVNKLIEKRGGVVLAAGDLVFKDTESEEKVLYGDSNLASLPKDQIKEDTPSYKDYVKVVTQEDIDNGEYGVFDMVLPIPGYDVVYPDNEIKEIINELLKKDKIEEGVDFFEKNQKATSTLPVAFRGSYRKVVLEPSGLQYTSAKYTKLEMPLILDDVPKNIRAKDSANGEKMETDQDQEKSEETKAEAKMETDVAKPEGDAANGAEKKEGEAAEKPKKEPPVELNALIVEFFLPKGTHFIVPIRELLKKNDFGALANPFFERLVEKPHIDRFKKTLKHMGEHFHQLQFAPPPPMRGPMGPPRPYGPGPMMPPAQPPDFALQKIQMLEAEIQNLRAQNQASQITQLASLNTALNTLLTQREGNKGGAGGAPGGPPRGNIRALFDEDGPYDQAGNSRVGNNYTDFENNSQPQLKRLRADFGRGNPEQINKNRFGGGPTRGGGNQRGGAAFGAGGPGNFGALGGGGPGGKGKFFGNNRPGGGPNSAGGQHMQGKRQGFGGGGPQKNPWQQGGNSRGGGNQKRGGFGNRRN